MDIEQWSHVLSPDSGERGISGDATLIVHVACHVNVAIHPPVLTPAGTQDNQ